jgi:hypothetical protein
MRLSPSNFGEPRPLTIARGLAVVVVVSIAIGLAVGGFGAGVYVAVDFITGLCGTCGLPL